MNYRRLILIIIMAGLGAIGGPITARAASLYFSPSSGEYKVGDSFTVSVKVSAGGQAINAAEANVTFPTDRLEFRSASTSGSIFSFWTTRPTGSNATGRVTFSGGLPNPGYSGSSGTVVKISWRAKTTGSATVQLTSGKVLANDGLGTDVLSGLGSGTYTIKSSSITPAPLPAPTPSIPSRPTPTVTSTSHPDQTAWSNNNRIKINWSQPSGITGVSYILNQSDSTTPDETTEANTGQTEFEISGDGVWYWHLRAKYAGGWSNVAHYRLQIDRTAPEPFTIEVSRDGGTADPTPILTWQATDALSGIAKYMSQLNETEPILVTSPQTLELTRTGDHLVKIVATDRAGNTRTAEISLTLTGYPPPAITSVTEQFVLLDQVTVRGTAQAGDTVTIYLDGQELGTTQAGPVLPSNQADIIIRFPWSFTSSRIIGPGHHKLTATATSPTGQVSQSTEPREVFVNGQSIIVGGRVYATFAYAPIVLVIILLLLLLLAYIYWRLWRLMRQLFRREEIAREEIDDLRHEVIRRRVSPAELEEDLEKIEAELTPSRPLATRRKKKS